MAVTFALMLSVPEKLFVPVKVFAPVKMLLPEAKVGVRYEILEVVTVVGVAAPRLNDAPVTT